MSTATIKLRIENSYADGAEIETEAVVTVPLPYPEDSDEREDWEGEHIFPETGTGRSGDAVYEVWVVESTAPELLGKNFRFGF
ncbi:hypothetical protein SEA_BARTHOLOMEWSD_78 [Streptomyces phage BartholomewSD]|uniref:Uncharacterized protein n=1 Tax=Streptomyces phage Alvy TaxID=2599888 RepID=A0A5J6TP41_9CAUD|nr:hypothetical protein KGG89_gp16 [Streptomyces phage Alvy]QAX95527.1 hypothetical protein SEA_BARTHOLOMEWSD_78 [Streptomyces phage BartholomewSD]QFG12486.1 hypothetical protein SEA_ALVY_78 [Streptomyces phage Alvy]